MPELIPGRFADFLSDKIQTLRDELGNSVTYIAPDHDPCPSVSFHQFRTVPEDSVRKIIMSSPSKSYSLDPVPTWLLTHCLDELTPTITNIVNLSFQNGRFSNALKFANITPIIKKQNLDPDNLRNYRPIAILTFLGKTIERAVGFTNTMLSGHSQSRR